MRPRREGVLPLSSVQQRRKARDGYTPHAAACPHQGASTLSTGALRVSSVASSEESRPKSCVAGEPKETERGGGEHRPHGARTDRHPIRKEDTACVYSIRMRTHCVRACAYVCVVRVGEKMCICVCYVKNIWRWHAGYVCWKSTRGANRESSDRTSSALDARMHSQSRYCSMCCHHVLAPARRPRRCTVPFNRPFCCSQAKGVEAWWAFSPRKTNDN